MVPDTYQQAWQAQSSQTRVTIDADLLLKEVQRSQGELRATIYVRDLREIVVALVMLPVWFYLGLTFSLPWTWYLVVPAFVWVIGFILVDRRRHPQQPSEPGEPVLASVQQSVTQVEHQIWLLRNVLWWYLLPFAIPLLAFFAQVAWQTSDEWWEGALSFGLPSLFVIALYYLIYCLNQSAVRSQLEPRRQYLLALHASLQDESTDEDATTDSAEEAAPPGILKRLLIVACLCIVMFMAGRLAVKLSGDFSQAADYPKLSPFAAVRWQVLQPEVQVGGQWYRLVSLNDVAAEEIVAFSRETYGSKWQKRFEEDLVELLSRMGHPPRETVKLVVQSSTSRETRVLEDVRMTAANRKAIRAAAEARAKPKP